MKLKFAQVAAATAIAAAAVFAVPAAAQAYTTPTTGQVSSATVGPGGTVTFDVPDGTFVGGEPVSVSVTGEGATGASFAILKFAPSTQALGTVTATDIGGIEAVTIRFPSTASGPHTILATSPSVPGGIAAYVTVVGGATGSAGGSSDGLAATGFNNGDLLGIWVGGGALVLVGGGLAVASAVRRNRKLAAGS